MAKIAIGNEDEAVDLTKVEIRPIIVDGLYKVKCVKVEQGKTADGTARLLKLTYATTGASRSIPSSTSPNGNEVAPGVLINDNCLLDPKGGMTIEMIGRKLKELALCFSGECGSEFDTDYVDGLEGEIKVKIKEADEKYAARNEVARYIPKGK